MVSHPALTLRLVVVWVVVVLIDCVSATASLQTLDGHNAPVWPDDFRGFFCLGDTANVTVKYAATSSLLDSNGATSTLFFSFAWYNPTYHPLDPSTIKNTYIFPYIAAEGNSSTASVDFGAQSAHLSEYPLLMEDWEVTSGFFFEVHGDDKGDSAQQHMIARIYSDPFSNTPTINSQYSMELEQDRYLILSYRDEQNNVTLVILDCGNFWPIVNIPEVANDTSLDTFLMSTEAFIEMYNDQSACVWGARRMYWFARHRVDREKLPVHGLSRWKQSLKAALSLVAGLLSALGSLFITFPVLIRWKRTGHTSPRDRILLGMSCIDVIASISLGLGPIPTPSEDLMGSLVLSSGTTNTCTAQGFGVQVGFGVPLYNCSLCIYYLLVIAFGKRDREVATRFEWSLHLLPLLFAFSTAIAGVLLNLFHTNGSFCWIEPSPFNCFWNY